MFLLGPCTTKAVNPLVCIELLAPVVALYLSQIQLVSWRRAFS
jgi:hypothetical protein